jgi:hypothetical protein
VPVFNIALPTSTQFIGKKQLDRQRQIGIFILSAREAPSQWLLGLRYARPPRGGENHHSTHSDQIPFFQILIKEKRKA